MQFCYVDEAGSAELLTSNRPDSTPIFVLGGLIVPDHNQMELVWEFLQLKKRFRPRLATQALSEVIRQEIKGSDLRADMRSDKRNRRRSAQMITGAVLNLVVKYDCQIVARVVVKEVNTPLNDTPLYSSALGWIATTFHARLDEADSTGLLILDSRTKVKNTPNVARITTQKYRTGGDPLRRLAEVPVFGHSDTHVGLQIADIVTSAILFPAACSAFCSGLTWNTHAHVRYESAREWFGATVKARQYRYQDGAGLWKGGIYVTGRPKLRAVDMFTSPLRQPSLPFPPTRPHRVGATPQRFRN